MMLQFELSVTLEDQELEGLLRLCFLSYDPKLGHLHLSVAPFFSFLSLFYLDRSLDLLLFEL
jgi:hypothetical protein